MIQKQFIKSRNVYKVKFQIPTEHLPDAVEVEQIALVGDFNGWDTDAIRLKFNARKKVYQAELELEPGSQHQFRYVMNESIWLNDWAADAYVPNSKGSDNCVVIASTAVA